MTRSEQLRAAKRAQRIRQRDAGLRIVELLLPEEQADQLRLAAKSPGFSESLEQFLSDLLVDIQAWPALRELTWNRKERWIPAQEALALYERNWRFIDEETLSAQEAELINRLVQRFGSGVLHV